jgi:hypothetical protein
MTYRVLTNSRRIEKDFLRIITGFSEDEQNTIWQILRLAPKGSGETHWTIKKVDKNLVFYQFRQLFYAASPLPEHSWDFSDSFSEPHL